jgi:DNA-binding transcriptional regulator YiaG
MQQNVSYRSLTNKRELGDLVSMTGSELRAALQRLGLRHGTFAQLLGVHRVTVGRWLSGLCSEREVPRYASAYIELAERSSIPSASDIIDENFTGGVRSEDYLARLRNGE